MKKNEITVGGTYIAKVAGNITTVRVDAIREVECWVGLASSGKRAMQPRFDVTNLATGRKTTFRSAAKFRAAKQVETITPVKAAAILALPGEGIEEAMEQVEQQPEVLADPSDEVRQNWDRGTMQFMEGGRVNHPKPSGLAGRLAAQTASESGAPHVQLKALAGTGKTTSCIQGLMKVKEMQPTITPSPQQDAFWQHMGLGRSETVRLSAFNSTITDEMKERLATSGLDRRGCEARGVHSLGLQSVTKQFGRLEASKWAVLDLIAEVMGGDFHDLKKQKGVLVTMNAVDDLVSLCKQNLVEPTPENLDRLASHYDVEVENWSRVNELVPTVLDRCKSPKRKIAFDDMVWLPLVLDLPILKVDVQIIDEAQDLNRMQQELVYRGGHRVLFVGDPHQAIYGFAGADSESMPRMSRTLGATPRGCVELPLTVTRRCGKAIVEEARRIVPEYEAHESNGSGFVGEARYPTKRNPITGKVDEIKWEDSYSPLCKDGAMILCRVNAPLVSQCFRFLKRGIKANILGRDMVKGLTSLIEKSKAHTVEHLRGWMQDWIQKETDIESKKRYASEARLIALQDRHDCVMCFADGCTYTSEVVAKINQVFTDSKSTTGIRLSSIHKSKGLEARQVFFLQPRGGECPHPMAKSAWQQEQEMNLKYVATTRAIEELWIVS